MGCLWLLCIVTFECSLKGFEVDLIVFFQVSITVFALLLGQV